MVDYEKRLPLIPNSDQIDVIKPLNHQKQEERYVEIQASISLNLLNQISSSCPPWMRNLVKKKLELRDLRREVSKQISWIDF